MPLTIGSKRAIQQQRREDITRRTEYVRTAIYDTDMTTIELQEAIKYLLDIVDELAAEAGILDRIS